MEQPKKFLPRAKMQTLIDTLKNNGYQCVGPRVEDEAIQFDELHSVEELPKGVRDSQAPGSYRLSQVDNSELNFSWASGPQALKPYLYASREPLWQAETTEQGIKFTQTVPTPEPTAVIGARACDIAAMQIQDQHFLGNTYVDPYYKARRDALFLVAVNCSHPAETCFCVSTGDGPAASSGFDLALSELDEGFIIQSGSDKGQAIFDQLPLEVANGEMLSLAASQIEQARHQQKRAIVGQNLNKKIFDELDNAQWDQIAERCLSCGNCTAVCPTCFCHREVEIPKLDGQSTTHIREWDSCFNQDHSYIVGEVVRETTAYRYRQWMTHKLGSWHDQYGRSGCVGCGRCTTWCPAAIDFVKEANHICGEA